jgi:hypothetical protein
MDDDDFFEPDEPVNDVLKAFDSGTKGLTRRPERGQTAFWYHHAITLAPRVETQSRQQGQTATLSAVKA